MIAAMVAPLSILLIGPGAVGLTLAGALLENGHEVTFATRTPFDRLTLDTPDRRLQFPARRVQSPADIARPDLAILAVKAHQTPAAGPWIAAAVRAGAPLLIAQNGVDHRERIGDLLAAEGCDHDGAGLVPAVVYLPARRDGAGAAALTGRARLALEDTPEAARFEAAFAGSFVVVERLTDWITSAWTKLLMNSASGALCAPLSRPIAILDDPGARSLAVDLIREAIPIARAEGADLTDDVAERLIAAMLKGARDHFPSIAQDQMAGAPTEWRVRNEVIVRIARKHGLPAPLNAAFATLLRLLDPAERAC
jgi:2-dehydropantoate 2-reductase